MNEDLNIYCDESCHGINDGHEVMVIGALSCPTLLAREVATRLREIKIRHRLNPNLELKWTKVSKGKSDYYLDVLNFFLTHDQLRFRAVIIPEKSQLKHEAFGQTHDEWYYKMFFTALKPMIRPGHQYYIYLDYKDTQSGARSHDLHKILRNNFHDPESSFVRRVQPVLSHHVEQIQLADFLVGLISYANRNLETNSAKLGLVRELSKRTGFTLRATTPLQGPYTKVNIFRWAAQQ